MPVKVFNNSYATLAAPVNPGDTSCALTGGHGARVPLVAGDWTYGTFIKTDGSLEIVKITARSVDNLTIVRTQDGTSALTLAVGDRLELRPCAALMNDLVTQEVDSSRKAVLTGTDSYAGTLSPAITVLTQQLYLVQFPNANTVVAATLNLNAIGAKTLKNRDGGALAAGDIKAGSWHLAYYDGTNFVLLTIAPIDATALVPSGTIIHVARQTAPAGYLKADGSAVSRTTYSALFAAIGTAFGVGDNVTTFNLPDLRGEFVRGWDDGRGVDSGRAFGTAQQDAFQGHVHPNGQTNNALNNAGGAGWWDSYPSNTGNPTTDGVNGTPRTAAETRPRNIALLACIKT